MISRKGMIGGRAKIELLLTQQTAFPQNPLLLFIGDLSPLRIIVIHHGQHRRVRPKIERH